MTERTERRPDQGFGTPGVRYRVVDRDAKETLQEFGSDRSSAGRAYAWARKASKGGRVIQVWQGPIPRGTYIFGLRQ